MARLPARVILGLMTVGPAACANSRITTIESLKEFLSTFKSSGHSILDTARAYPPGMSGKGEEMLGEAGTEGFVVDSKVNSFVPGAHSKVGSDQSLGSKMFADEFEMSLGGNSEIRSTDIGSFENVAGAFKNENNDIVFSFTLTGYDVLSYERVDLCALLARAGSSDSVRGNLFRYERTLRSGGFQRSQFFA